jgi:hypothetical protein
MFDVMGKKKIMWAFGLHEPLVGPTLLHRVLTLATFHSIIGTFKDQAHGVFPLPGPDGRLALRLPVEALFWFVLTSC